MKRYKFSQVSCLDNILETNQPFDVTKLQGSETSKKKSDGSVFKIIFADDPVTGRPRSDLGTYLTDETNPLVRDFIERQLRQDFNGKIPSIPDGISDRDLAILTKDRFESIDEYVKRVNQYCQAQKQKVQTTLKRAAIRKRELEIRNSRKSE